MNKEPASAFSGIIADNPLPPDAGIIHHSEGVGLLPANIELSGLGITLVNTMNRETALLKYIFRKFVKKKDIENEPVTVTPRYRFGFYALLSVVNRKSMLFLLHMIKYDCRNAIDF